MDKVVSVKNKQEDNVINFDFKSLTRDQVRVIGVLNKAEKMGLTPIAGIPKVYLGAIKVLQQKDNPDRFSQAAHSFRELITLLTRDTQREIEEICPKCKSRISKNICSQCQMPLRINHKKRIELFITSMDPRGELNSYNTILADKLLKAYKPFLAWTHHGGKKKFPENEVGQLEQLILGFFKPYFENKTFIKSLIYKPSQENYAKITPIFAFWESVNYFYSNASANWFEVLQRNDAFINPPDVIKKNDLLRPVPWPQSNYLKRIAQDKPIEVAKIIFSCKDTDNWVILEDFVEAALKIQSDNIEAHSKIVRACVNGYWLDKPYSFAMPEKIGKYALKLLGTDIQLSMKLLEYLLTPILDPRSIKEKSVWARREAKPKFADHEYEKVIEEIVPKFINRQSFGTFKVISYCLKCALIIEKEEKDDYSYIWRPLIAVSNKRYFTLKDELVTQIVKSGLQAAKKDIKKIISFLNTIIAKTTYSVFTRIKMHIVSKLRHKNMIRQYLLSDTYYYDSNFRKEIMVMLATGYRLLNDIDKKMVLSLIEKGVSKKNFIEQYKKNNKQKPKPSEIADYLLYSNREKEEYLNSINTDPSLLVDKLADKAVVTSWVGPTSPIKIEELKAKNDKELISYLKTWEPKDDIFAPSRDGLSSLLTAATKDDPGRFERVFPDLITKVKKPEYLYGAMRGFCDLSEDQCKIINWAGLLNEFLKIVLDRTYFSDSNGWSGSVLKSILDILEEALNNNLISLKDKDIAWKIILELTKHKNPSREEEIKSEVKAKRDYSLLAINSIRSKAYEVIISYGLWQSRQTKGKTKMTSEIRKLLNNSLDSKKEKALSIKAVYAMLLPNLIYLDKRWVISNIDRIFPKIDEFDSLLACYTMHGQYYDETYTILRSKFEYFLNQYLPLSESKDMVFRVAEHILIAYLRKIENFSNKSLIGKLFYIDNPDLSGHCVEFIGRELENLEQNKFPEITKRAYELWEWIIENIENKKIIESKKQISSQFGIWFHGENLDRKWLIENLREALKSSDGSLDYSYEILQRLTLFVREYPEEVVDCLMMIAKAPSNPKSAPVFYDKEDLFELLNILKEKSNVKKQFNTLVDYLAKMGIGGVEEFQPKNLASENKRVAVKL